MCVCVGLLRARNCAKLWSPRHNFWRWQGLPPSNLHWQLAAHSRDKPSMAILKCPSPHPHPHSCPHPYPHPSAYWAHCARTSEALLSACIDSTASRYLKLKHHLKSGHNYEPGLITFENRLNYPHKNKCYEKFQKVKGITGWVNKGFSKPKYK